MIFEDIVVVTSVTPVVFSLSEQLFSEQEVMVTIVVLGGLGVVIDVDSMLELFVGVLDGNS